MSKRLILSLSFVLSALCAFCSSSASAQGTDWYKAVTENKPYVRWWWQGSAVDTAGLKYNLEAFAKAGIGGYEVTPIYGVQGNEANDIDYLSDKWMEMYDYLVSESERLGLECDLNNGTGWPFGGPHITPEIAAQKMQVSADGVKSVQTGQKVKRAAPGGEGFVMDHYNPEALKVYLGRTDEAFAKSGSKWPNTWFNDSYEVYGANWTPEYPAIFKERYGYDIEKYLIEGELKAQEQRAAQQAQREEMMKKMQQQMAQGQRIQMPPQGQRMQMPPQGQVPQGGKAQPEVAKLNPKTATDYDRAICDYRELLGNLLVENFITPWIEWGHSHGSRIRNQSHGSPANILDVYGMVDIPECETYGRTEFDIPGLRQDSIIKKNDGDPAVLKLASSAAHVTGKKYTSCETLTWMTEHFRTSLSQCKPEIDQAFASGVNHIFFHGAAYSPKDAAFPGWHFYAAIDMSPTSGMWPDAPELFKYVERCQAFLTAGEADSDFLLYLPVYDAWSRSTETPYMMFDIHGMGRTLPDAKAAMNAVMERGYDADYISDKQLINIDINKPVLVPNCTYMPVETARRLVELKKKGVPVFFIDGLPQDVPGLHNLDTRRKEFKKIAKGFGKPVSLDKALSIAKPEEFKTKEHGTMIRRRNECGGYNYFASMLSDNKLDGWVKLGTSGNSAMLFDPMHGISGKAQTRQASDGCLEVRLQLNPGESILIKTFPNEISAPDWTYVSREGKAIALNTGWSISFPKSDPEIPGSFQTNKPVDWTTLKVDAAKVNWATARYTGGVSISDVKEADEWVLDLGDVRESARVFVNRKEVGVAWAVPFRINIGEYLQEGLNIIDVYVTNLQSNRIADYDRRGVKWKIFKDANINGLVGAADFSKWSTDPSGLCSEVKLIPIYYDFPAKEEVLAQTIKVNDYFMAKFPKPGDLIPFPTRGRSYESIIWTRAVYFEGLMALNAVNPQQRYLDYTREWGDFHDWGMRNGDTKTRNADNYCCAQPYIDFYRLTGEEKMIEKVKVCFENILGTEASDADWTWIDAIQMGMPGLVKYGVTTGNKAYFEKAWTMYNWARERFWNAEDGLWWRDKNFKAPYREPNGEDCYWSRGNGWVIAALARVLEELPADDPHRSVYVADFKAMCEALLKCQREDGTWNCSLHDPTNFGGPEATGTSLFSYGIAWGLRKGLLDVERYRPALAKAWNGLNRICIHDNGFIGYSQGSGKEPKEAQPLSYNKIPDFEDFGTGCFVLAGSEIYKYLSE